MNEHAAEKDAGTPCIPPPPDPPGCPVPECPYTAQACPGHDSEKDVPKDLMYRANLIGCSRCSNEGQDDPIPFARSWERFMSRGWTFEDGRVFCPQCGGETGRPIPPTEGRT